MDDIFSFKRDFTSFEDLVIVTTMSRAANKVNLNIVEVAHMLDPRAISLAQVISKKLKRSLIDLVRRYSYLTLMQEYRFSSFLCQEGAGLSSSDLKNTEFTINHYKQLTDDLFTVREDCELLSSFYAAFCALDLNRIDVSKSLDPCFIEPILTISQQIDCNALEVSLRFAYLAFASQVESKIKKPKSTKSNKSFFIITLNRV